MLRKKDELGAVRMDGVVHGTKEGAVCCTPGFGGVQVVGQTLTAAATIMARRGWCTDERCIETLTDFAKTYKGPRCEKCEAPLLSGDGGKQCPECGFLE